MFDDMCNKKIISTRGRKQDAIIIDELLFDVNTEYFENKGGLEFAKEFYKKAYEYAIKEVGGEEFILSAVLHCDERNQEVSEKLGKDVYHYHLHVMYVPIVEKEIKWTKRCKDKDLVGKVKEVINQVSHSKKWASHKETDENGNSYLEKSYSLLQDRFYEYMLNQGYDDIQRGEKGSTTKNLTTTQYKVQQEEKKLSKNVDNVMKSESIINQQQDEIEENSSIIKEQASEISKQVNDMEQVAITKTKIKSIDNIQTKPTMLDKNKIVVDKVEFDDMKQLAKTQLANQKKEIKYKKLNNQLKQDNSKLNEKIGGLNNQVQSLNYQVVEYKVQIRKLNTDKTILLNNNNNLNNQITKLETEKSVLKSVMDNFISYLLDLEKFFIKFKLIDLLIDLLTPSKFIQSQEDIIKPPKQQEKVIQPKKKKRSMER